MHNVLSPDSITFSAIDLKRLTLSPSNYKSVTIKNNAQCALREFLSEDHPFSQGVEPGGIAYVRNSNVAFLRNSCIDPLNVNYLPSKLIFLNPRYGFSSSISEGDVLVRIIRVLRVYTFKIISYCFNLGIGGYG